MIPIFGSVIYLTRNLIGLGKLIANSSLVLLYSTELIEEFVVVANRPKFKKYFSEADLTELLQQIYLHAEFIEVNVETDLCRDPKDNFLLSLAKAGRATHLLSGDKDLLELKNFNETSIMTIAKYLNDFKVGA